MPQFASQQKVTTECSKCNDKKLKSLIYAGTYTDWVMFAVLLFLTGGLGLLKVSLWRKPSFNAYCEGCGNKFGKFKMNGNMLSI